MTSAKEQTKKVPVPLDEKDHDILRLLETDPKLTVRDIAAKINLSATPTHERIKRLEKTGVIKHYAAILDKRMVNKGIMVICMITLREHNKKAGAEFINAVMQFKEVLECYNISGDFDFMLKIVSESMDSYHDFFVNQLGEVAGLGQTKSIFVMDIIKETHQLL
ncbi:Lrp/AsnC family transcriptional regulator [Mucilaginibacter gynuensis]|uniref:Lrp/AsnC family transcriptional regulator n=1 Tax=Mucilaginibacter gynuensis TaxID=1302236 RepID=A0ABP8G9I2_9SPHI